MYPETLEEAMCHIKRDIKRRRYGVDANIITPYRRHSYRHIGWDLAFDQISDTGWHMPSGR